MAVPLFFIADFSTLLPHIGLSLPRRIPGMNAYPALPSMAAAVWIGISLLFILGLLDDFIHIKPHTKLVGQILVASLVSFMGFRLHWFTSLTLDTVVTIFWIVGLTNAFNLIDNMDGLCAGVGLIAAVYFVPLFIETSGNPNIAGIVAMILAGSLGGFLVYNFNPASIFMGDCGSLTIGFTLSMIGLYYADTRALSELSSFAVPIMILMVPVLDTTMVTLIRILSGRKASVGGKDHTSHRLVLMGFSEKGAVMFLYGVGAVSGIAALFVSRSDSLTSPAAIIPLAISILLMGVYLAQIRVYPEKEFSLLRGHAYTPILMKLTYKRQIMFVLLDFCLIAFAYYLSYRLRFDTKSFPSYFNVFLHSLPAVIACKFLAFFTMGIYRGIWQYMSTNDVFVYIKASAAATLLSIVMVTFIYRFEDFLKGIFLVDWLLTTALVLGTRGSFRISADTMKRKTLSGDAVLIYGAGRGGEILIREILNNGKYKVRPVGLIDDDPLKVGKKLLGYPILGPFRDIELFLKKYRVSGMLISFNNRESRNIDAVRTFCREKGLFLRWFFIDIEEVEPGKLPNAAAEMPASLNDPLYESREVFGVRC
jgi:UDP-GlcNAc:undecaprenyl-phosphate GlcNAc-1-phosphate transferase